MEQDNNNPKNNAVFSKRLRAGRRRTYFFDVRQTSSNDYYLTITESKKRFNEDGYDRHKVFLYKEDFNRFLENLSEAIDHVKTELLPEYDFDEFAKKHEEYQKQRAEEQAETVQSETKGNTDTSGDDEPEQPEAKAADDTPEASDETTTSKTPEEEEVNEEDLKWD